MPDFDFDVFISHASEDKKAFVTPLANELKKHGLRVWFDKFTLKVGDSLHRSIEKGLARSRFGIVVFSPKFFAKNWPQSELDGLFVREMDGHKVILPVWHKMSAARMKTVLPILADRYALRSSDGVETVARSLVEVIRPELLELESKKAMAFEAGDAFIVEAKRKYPGYDFAIQSGPVGSSDQTSTFFAAKNAKRKINVNVSDPALIGRPLGGRVQFSGDGVKKAIEFERTGKPQKWEHGEFQLLDWNVPLMPTHLVEGSTLEVGRRNLPKVPPRLMRIEVGSRSPIVFPIMEMRADRLGTHEAEAIFADKESALRVSLVFPVGADSRLDGSREVDVTLSWEVAGKRVPECKKLIDAIDAIRHGRVLRFIDIRLDKRLFESTAQVAGRADPFSRALRRTVSLTSQIEKQFSVPLRMPEEISEGDDRSLFHLDCLLNGRAYGNASNTHLRLVKADGEVGAGQEAFIKGEWSATFTDAPSNYPGYFPLFGQQVKTRNWVRVVEFLPTKPGSQLKEFTNALLGSEISIEIRATGPALLRWRDESALKNIEVGTLMQPKELH